MDKSHTKLGKLRRTTSQKIKNVSGKFSSLRRQPKNNPSFEKSQSTEKLKEFLTNNLTKSSSIDSTDSESLESSDFLRTLDDSDIEITNSVVPYLEFQSHSPITEFLSRFFRQNKLEAEFYFCRDFLKTRGLPPSVYIAHAHILHQKYFVPDPLVELEVPPDQKESINKLVWSQKNGYDPERNVSSKLFEPVYSLCLDKLNSVFCPFSLKYPIEYLFNAINDLFKNKSNKNNSPLMSVTSSPEQWSVNLVTYWLKHNGFGSYVKTFRENKINGKMLINLSARKMDKLGITYTDQIRITELVKKKNE